MPQYTITNTITGETNTVILSIAEKEAFLETHPHYKQEITVPTIVGTISMPMLPKGRGKPAPEFREKLRQMKKAYTTKYTGKQSTINTFD